MLEEHCQIPGGGHAQDHGSSGIKALSMLFELECESVILDALPCLRDTVLKEKVCSHLLLCDVR